ncbi:dihydroorotate dehydrogenase electron transfer subunit [Thermobispora bispora]|uniref:2-polyprenylphenol hydroxylase/flavodoxin oxidoreductase n=1 Tax=Thermobispora bispora (strain ATCC 19993 / DSM 43833 / CBS 139.67 / JCM 10125 / KCTC 9307 / NBRC 14880 / R51) TaxID=469371 RepID=D6Y9F4_THEBD|nr:2-polyprenylphenol hydroxylase/flavodoxin oxidoreductase [Thermobispora bispora DSM 43833]QSI47937.1 dihydroorotate dehydrogenase electron transfer subunit [Thermobispora bispora]
MAASPVQVTGTVLTTRQVDAYHALTVVAPGIADRFRPGHFVTVAVGGPGSSMITRRALSIHDVTPDYGGTVELVFSVRGPGTAWLAGLRARDTLDLVGPLGRPFPLPRDPCTCVLVGWEYGSAPLFALGDVLQRRGCRIDFMLGAKTADRVFGALRARRMAETTTLVTEDGSLGLRGTVIDVLPGVIADTRADVVYASGPMPVLRGATAVAVEFGIPIQVAVEESMACGIGICMTCVVPVIGEDGVTRMVRACTEGPVFRGERVRFGDVGTIPFDALGAPGGRHA